MLVVDFIAEAMENPERNAEVIRQKIETLLTEKDYRAAVVECEELEIAASLLKNAKEHRRSTAGVHRLHSIFCLVWSLTVDENLQGTGANRSNKGDGVLTGLRASYSTVGRQSLRSKMRLCNVFDTSECGARY